MDRKLEVIEAKYGSRYLAQKDDSHHTDILDDVPTIQAYANLDKIVHRWNNHDNLQAEIKLLKSDNKVKTRCLADQVGITKKYRESNKTLLAACKEYTLHRKRHNKGGWCGFCDSHSLAIGQAITDAEKEL